jgi:hypothetical protein
MLSSPIHYFALLLPLVCLLAIALIWRISWRVAIVSALVAPLVGELVLLFWVSTARAHLVEPGYWLRFMAAAIIYFPFALVATGPWAALIGALAWLLVKSSSITSRGSFAKLSLIGALVGAVAGSVFILVYSLFAVIPDVPVRDYSFVPYFVLSGVLAGAVSGYVIAYFAGGSRYQQSTN